MSPFKGPHRFLTASAPSHKALIGINYTSTTDGNEQDFRQPKGPINDSKEVDLEEGFNRAQMSQMRTLRDLVRDDCPRDAFVILDASLNGTLLNLDHYSCHYFLPQRARSLQEEKHHEGLFPSTTATTTDTGSSAALRGSLTYPSHSSL
ncbi:hypothetical protein EDB92DRAFT_1956314 [Lactarius akahatsu]|uniref:Uncharacterized protein n=1 Tax=Lactarius akahatsu TaxID=416441 RepID=A0AAD4Q7H4_9AGAM|nr:hypothetical protein EDB92DRAFT_1956314 [Lactarius akahatsu]